MRIEYRVNEQSEYIQGVSDLVNFPLRGERGVEFHQKLALRMYMNIHRETGFCFHYIMDESFTLFFIYFHTTKCGSNED